MTLTVEITPGAPTELETPTTEELVARLGELGSACAIAAFFADEGVRGRRSSRFECPIAKWLQVLTGARHIVQATDVRREGSTTRIKLPVEATNFICEFDAGRYSGLAVGVPAYDIVTPF